MSVGPKITAFTMALVMAGCATTPNVPVVGRAVEVRSTSPKESPTVKGELIAVGPEQLWILGGAGIREVPLKGIDEVDVRRHGLDGKRAGLWAMLGGIVTGAALAMACGSVEGNNGCGKVFLGVGATWALFGGLSALSLDKSSRLPVHGPEWPVLRPYARFPQGLPPGLDPASLRPNPSPAPPERP